MTKLSMESHGGIARMLRGPVHSRDMARSPKQIQKEDDCSQEDHRGLAAAPETQEIQKADLKTSVYVLVSILVQ